MEKVNNKVIEMKALMDKIIASAGKAGDKSLQETIVNLKYYLGILDECDQYVTIAVSSKLDKLINLLNTDYNIYKGYLSNREKLVDLQKRAIAILDEYKWSWDYFKKSLLKCDLHEKSLLFKMIDSYSLFGIPAINCEDGSYELKSIINIEEENIYLESRESIFRDSLDKKKNELLGINQEEHVQEEVDSISNTDSQINDIDWVEILVKTNNVINDIYKFIKSNRFYDESEAEFLSIFDPPYNKKFILKTKKANIGVIIRIIIKHDIKYDSILRSLNFYYLKKDLLKETYFASLTNDYKNKIYPYADAVLQEISKHLGL